MKDINEFESLAKNVYDSNLISYSSIQVTLRNIGKLPKNFREKAVQEFCNEHDLKDDSERDIITFNNPIHKDLCKRLSNKKNSFADLAENYGDVLIGTMSGDFYD